MGDIEFSIPELEVVDVVGAGFWWGPVSGGVRFVVRTGLWWGPVHCEGWLFVGARTNFSSLLLIGISSGRAYREVW